MMRAKLGEKCDLKLVLGLNVIVKEREREGEEGYSQSPGRR